MGERDIHVPVLLERCLELLAPALARPGAVHLDATLGLGGHAEAVLAANPEVTLLGLDRDPQALALAGQRLAPYAGRTHLVHAVYDQLAEALTEEGLDRGDRGSLDGALFDLGVSSLQLDDASRGFAYAQDAPLDMRMDQTTGPTAAEVLNTYSPGDLTRIIRRYGEEKFASRVTAAIVRERGRTELNSSARLAELVRDAIPAAARRTGGHPAKRTFQALRIEVNGELSGLERALPAALDALKPGGRMVVLAYHSLEDRLVKHAFAGRARSSAPIDLPFEPEGSGPTLRLLVRGAEQAGPDEIALNPRSTSVRLRAVERIDPTRPAGPGRPPQGTNARTQGTDTQPQGPGSQQSHSPHRIDRERRGGSSTGRSRRDRPQKTDTLGEV